MTIIDISICPTNLSVGDDVMDGDLYLDAIREVVLRRWPDAQFATLQIGHSQGDEWFQVNGRRSEALRDTVLEIDTSDEALYLAKD